MNRQNLAENLLQKARSALMSDYGMLAMNTGANYAIGNLGTQAFNMVSPWDMEAGVNGNLGMIFLPHMIKREMLEKALTRKARVPGSLGPATYGIDPYTNRPWEDLDVQARPV